MVKYPQMRIVATVLLAVLVHASAFAAARVAVPSLPEPVRPLAEAETNVVFDAGAAGENLWRLVVELDASASNCVEVVLGVDADADGALGIEEGEFCVGWDCGEWFWRDRRGGDAGLAADAGGPRRLEWSVSLGRDRSARWVSGIVFLGVPAPTCFNPAWNMARVVSRGAESLRVESKVTVDALKVRVR